MMGRFALVFMVVAGCAVEPPGAPSGPVQGTDTTAGTPIDGSFRTAPAAMLICPSSTDIEACPVTTLELSPVTFMTWVALASTTQLTLDRIAVAADPEGDCVTAITLYTQVAGRPTLIGAYPGTLCAGDVATPLVADLPAGNDDTISVGGRIVLP